MTTKYSPAAFQRAVDSGVSRAAIALAAQMQVSLSGASPSAPGTPPGVRTGTARRSIFSQMRGPGYAVAGTNLRYMRIHEFGGTIHPKRAQYLAVPIGEAGRQASRRVAGNIRALNLKYRPPKARGRNGGTLCDPATGQALFVLLKSVTLPRRPWAMPSVRRAKSRMQAAFKAGFVASAHGGRQ